MTTKAPKSQPAELEPVTAAAAAAPEPDANHGRGGMYTVTNGQRVLTHRTQAEHEAGAADATQPATPVNPDTTE